MSDISLASLHAILQRSEISSHIVGDDQVTVHDAFHDHSQVNAGSLYAAIRGAHFDGHDFGAAAHEAGATALLVDHSLNIGVPELVVDDVRGALGIVAAAIHGYPSKAMDCIAVTGTNGKTTTVSLLAAIARAGGKTPGIIGTLTGVRTTPEATDLQRQLRRLCDKGCDFVAMEVSSHALTQGRVIGTHFSAAVFTNLSPEHLDFHGTMEAYFRAKARLFEPDLSAHAIVNLDDPYGRLLADASHIPTTGFSLADAEPIKQSVPLDFVWRAGNVHMSLSGTFNVSNALAAATAASIIGFSDEQIRVGLSSAAEVPGRFEIVACGQPFRVVVDFAHTPDGIVNLLDAARDLAGAHRVLIVFGAGGDRDASKRPLMGEAAARGADVVIVTTDNARTEDPRQIADQILSGMEPGAATVELDRRAAIALSFGMAEPGDVVVIAGKGHETSQVVGSSRIAFDDREVAREILGEMRFAS